MQGTFTSHACTTLAAVRAGSSTLTALVDTIVLDPSVDWIATKRAAAAARGLDSAMALRLWLTHLEETLPQQFSRLQGLMHASLPAALHLAQRLQASCKRERRAVALCGRVDKRAATPLPAHSCYGRHLRAQPHCVALSYCHVSVESPPGVHVGPHQD